jgi:Zn-dependent protease
VAKYFGDNTAYAAGRMTLNPLVHIDLFGTIIIPTLLYLTTGFVFGYAKPVPIDFSRLKNPKRDMAWVALAGPAANFIMGLMWLILAILLAYFRVDEPFPHRVAQAGVLANVLMFAFNLIPIPPLDGGRIVTSILPNKLAWQYAKIEPYGFFIVLALLYFKLLNYWVGPMIWLANNALGILATPLALLTR